MKNLFKFLSASLFICSYGLAEIEELKLQWTPALCNTVCAKNLDIQFRKIYEIEEVAINQPAGQAVLKYKPRGAYKFGPINVAMELIGLTINDIHIKVKGTIKHSSKEVYLISSGDGTSFTLMSPVQPQTRLYSEQYNPDTHRMTISTRNQLLEVETNKSEVTISGQLFEPERALPNLLIVENFTNDDTNKNN